jgi:hypothetical protein
MRIAVFGDSFANHQLENNSIGKAWVDIIAQQHEVVNFGESGSSFQYSYELFLKEHNNFDFVIFLATSPDRKYLKVLDPIFSDYAGKHMLGHKVVTKGMKEKLNELDISKDDREKYTRILDSFRVYYDEWRDLEYEKAVQDALVRSIPAIKPQSLVIPCFLDSMSFLKIKDTVYTVQLAETASLDVDLNNVWIDYYCLRKCHLCEDNNIILGNKILDAMSKGINYLDLDIKDFVTKLDKPTEYYLRKHV